MVRWGIPAVLLLLLVVLLFNATVRFGFVGYDDPQRITENPIVAEGLSLEGFRWAWTTSEHAPYRHPLSWLSHMLDCELYGFEPAGHHATNVAIHALNAVLLFSLLFQLTGTRWRSFWVAGLFALHPVQVGTVAWISARPDLLATLFSLLTLMAYGWNVRNRCLRNQVLIAVAMTAAILSKPVAVTLPVAMLLIDLWPLERWQVRRPATVLAVVAEKLPWLLFAVLGAVYGVLLDDERIGGLETGAEVALPLRLANAVVSHVRYLGHLFYPRDLSVHYPHPDLAGGVPWSGFQVALAALLLAAITLAAVQYRRGFLAGGWLWFGALLLPVSGIMQVGDQAMADRYVYLPMVGIAVAIVWLVHDLLVRSEDTRLWRVAGSGAMVVVLAVSFFASRSELHHWQDSKSLFTRAVEVYPDDPIMIYNLGVTLERAGELGPAEERYRRAVEIKPDYALAHNNLGTLLAGRKRFEEALSHFESALAMEPEFLLALRNAGNASMMLERYAEAALHYRRAIELNPEDRGLQSLLDAAKARARPVAVDPDSP